MIEAVVETVTTLLGVSGVQTGVLAFLAAMALYSRKALGVGALVAAWVRTLSIVAIVLVVLLATGVLEGVDVSALAAGFRFVFDILKAPFTNAVAVAAADPADLVLAPLEAILRSVYLYVEAVLEAVA